MGADHGRRPGSAEVHEAFGDIPACRPVGDDLRVLLEPKALKRQIAYFESIGFDITTPPPVSGDETPLGDIFTLSNAVEPPPELWGDDDDAECVEC